MSVLKKLSLSSEQKKFLRYFFAFYFLVLLLLFVFQRDILFEPDTMYYTPRELNLTEVDIHHIETFDGLKLEGWYFHSREEDAPLIVFFHGNAGNIEDRIELTQKIRTEGIDIFIPIYRGYSGMPGEPRIDELYKDAQTWLDYVQETFPDKKLVLHGRSLGSAIASKVAGNVKAHVLIMEVPFTSVADVAQKRYPFLPVKPLILDNFDNDKNLREVHEYTYFIGAGLDNVVPVDHTLKLEENFFGPRGFYIYPDGKHTNLYDLGLAKKIKEFLQERLPNR